MIVTVMSVVVLVTGLLSLLLALYGGVVSLRITENDSKEQEVQQSNEEHYYLLGMIGIIVLLARLLIAPMFFWMLQSMVPYCPGAMCIYGVLNVSAPYSSVALVLKLTLPFIYGLWIVFEVVNRRQPIPPYVRSLALVFLFALVPLVMADSALDILVVTAIRPVYAPCCSSIYDVSPPFSPSALLGPSVGLAIVLLTIAVSVALILVQWAPTRSRLVPVVTLVLGSAAALLYLVTLHDTLAPLVLGLPDHHCPYCLFQTFPDTALFAGFFWVGVATGAWRAALEIADRSASNLEDVGSIMQNLLKVSTVSILFSMVSLVSHIIVAT